jgi:hypothetical protein
MIQTLIIGNTKDVNYYSKIISQMNYFAKSHTFCVENGIELFDSLNLENYDALLFVSKYSQAYSHIVRAIKNKKNIYFCHQPNISNEQLNNINTLSYEANNVLYPEIIELKHPLIEDFLATQKNYLLYRYNKNVTSNTQAKDSLLNALSFITILSPMPVKNIDINASEASPEGHSVIKIKLKLFDSSLGYIMLSHNTQKEHNIIIESLTGNFIFNFTYNYLENSHGIRFSIPQKNNKSLTEKTLEDFALCIIFNKKPIFSIYHYSLVCKTLKNIENILPRLA